MIQRSRDLVTEQLTLDYFVQRAAGGWKLSAVEWVREIDDGIEAPPAAVFVENEEIPYGLRISPDGFQLEPNPVERTVLLMILDRIVHEERITQIASELNSKGFRMRQDRQWTATAVFELLPRLIETGPGLLKSPEWQAIRMPARK